MLNELNDMQKEAVLYNDGPLLIIAGAGSGKTKTLTTKIAYLIENGVNPANILAITFTNKAAQEMKDRIYKMVGSKAKESQISTFHSFGVKLIRDNATLLGYDSNFVIMDSDDSLSVVKKILKDMNLDPKKFNAKGIKNRISSCKNVMQTPDDFSKYAVSEIDNIFLDVYKKYEDYIYKNDAVDFDDLLILPIKLFREHEDILSKYQDRYQYILIDEYQDTNEAQYILTKMLAVKYKNLTCVGDDSQSIYSFRGANYKNILNFENDYKNAKVILLEENYRSTKYILDAANAVIKNNVYKKDKNLWTRKIDGDKIKYYNATNQEDEARYVCNNIKDIVKDNDYSNIAILFRTNAQSRVMEEECLKEDIPYKVIGSTYFYSRKEIKDLIAYIRLIHNTQDNVSLTRIINVPRRGIGEKSISNLAYRADCLGISMFDAIEDKKQLAFKEMILKLILLQPSLTLTEFIDKILDTFGIIDELKQENSFESNTRIENLEEFKSITKSFEEENEGLSNNEMLESFLFRISLVSDVEEYKNDVNRVSLMTVHQVKGLEYDYVFVIGLEEGVFPHFSAISDSSELEEERRLMYVAITRAKKHLYLINAKRRMLFGQTQRNLPSRFIEEIPKELLDVEAVVEPSSSFNTSLNKTPNVNKEEFKDYLINGLRKKKKDEKNEDSSCYNVGDRVNHKIFGVGVVTRIDGSVMYVAFEYKYGIKMISTSYKGISKV